VRRDRFRRVATLGIGLGLSTALHTLLSAQTVVVRRADIEREGWNRVTEILDGAVGWGRSSVDGFSYSASPDRLPAAGESGPSMPEWLVVVNGQRVPTDLFGLHLLELLPISVGQIDSVVFTRGPIISAGAPAARGVMSIFLRRVGSGLHAELTYQHGDESGDPGPYRYTNLASPNVEKIGPFAHGDIGWRGQAWDVEAGVHVASINITDTLISSRFSPTTFAGVRPDVIAITPTLRAGGDALGGRHELMVSFGEQRGLMFIAPQRSEQSLRTRSTYVGVDGSLNGAGSTTVVYEGSTSVLDASELASPLAFSVGHTRRHVGGTVSASRSVGRATLAFGAVADRWTLVANAVGESATSSGGGPLMRASLPISRSVTVDGSATLIFDGAHSPVLDAAADASFRLDSLTSVTIHGSQIRGHPNMDGSWIDAFMLGYQLPARAPTLTGIGVTLAHRFVPYLGAAVEVRGETVADWAGLSRPTSTPFASPADPVLHDGTLIGGHVRVETVGHGVWQGSLEYDRSATVNLDDRTFDSEVASTAIDDLRAQLSASPVRDFRLSGIAHLTGGTRWPAFAGSTGSPATVPPVRRLDASIEKWMRHRRLRLELLYRNLLNEPERYHPFGAQWNLRWHVSGSLMF
jgi:hypothetical protein